MARDFNGSSDLLSGADTALPSGSGSRTLAFWGLNDVGFTATSGAFGLAYGTNAASQQVYLGIYDLGVDDLIIFGDASVNIQGTTAITTGVWNHYGVTYNGTTARLYFNGVEEANGAYSLSTTLAGAVKVGCNVLESGEFWNGRLAEEAIWSAELTAAEMLSLADGVIPAIVRPESLVWYPPLWGRYSTEPELIGGAGLTVTGAAAGEHPRVIHPTRRKVYVPAAAAATLAPQRTLTGVGV